MNCPSCGEPVVAGAEACLKCGKSLSVLTIGSLLGGRYELRAVLGKGGMGLVYRAHDRLLEEEVAIKVLRTDVAPNLDGAKRFRSEIKLARKVSHPNVCRIHDYGEEGPLGFISMEILLGHDLQRELKDHPEGLPTEKALSYVLQIAAGLQAIHDVGILHRDLKTANATVDERGVVRLMDFGIAKDLLSQGETATGQALGTPEYMSPEQCRGEALDFRSDIYSLAVMAYELFTGDLPLKGSTLMATLFKQIQETPSFESTLGARVPRHLVPVLRKALSKSPDERYRTVKDFAQALREAHITAESSRPPDLAPETVATSEVAAARPPKAAAPEAPAGAAAPPAVAPSGPPTPPNPTPGFPADGKDRRNEDRIQLPTDIRFRKVAADGKVEREERTIAHDVSRRGMRILTSWTDLEVGSIVEIVEVGGDFTTRATIRNVLRGKDHITRVGVQFIDQRAPARLVGSSESRRASVRTPRVPPTPTPPPRPSVAFSTRVETPPARPSVAVPVRPEPPRPTPPPAPQAGPAVLDSDFVPGTVLPEEEKFHRVQAEMSLAKRLLAENKVWDAIQKLNGILPLAKGTAEATLIRIMVAEAEAKNPKWIRRAQQGLEELARENPDSVMVQLALARVFKQAGVRPRARLAFQRVLTLDPHNREAREALNDLGEAGSAP